MDTGGGVLDSRNVAASTHLGDAALADWHHAAVTAPLRDSKSLPHRPKPDRSPVGPMEHLGRFALVRARIRVSEVSDRCGDARRGCRKLTGMERREYDVVLVPEAEGGFSVFVPDLPSVATQGETVEEALDMARDAIEGYLEIMRDEGWPVPTVRRERVAVEAA